MINHLRRLLNWLVDSNIFVAFCVLALLMSSALLLESPNLKMNLFVFFATLFTYNFQRIVKGKQRKEGLKNDWLSNNRISTYSLMLVGGITGVYHFYFFKIETQIVIVLSAIICILYPFGLRKIPYVKIFIISLVWTVSSMLLLIIENNILFTQNIYLHLLARFLFVFAITIPFDIRDVKYDDSTIKTIPILFGVTKSKRIAVVSLIFAQVISVVQMSYLDMPIHFLISFLCLFFLTSFFIINCSTSKGAIYYSFWMESMSVFYYLFLIASTLLI